MRIDCLVYGTAPLPADVAQRVVIVIDVLRATSTIVAALAHGATQIIPVSTVQEALQQRMPDDLLAGEHNGRPLAGCDYGNSPSSFTPARVAQRRLLLTTTNGTKAIVDAMKAHTLFIAALTNVHACAHAALKTGRHIVLYCAGTKGAFALEDGLCAGVLLRMWRPYLPQNTPCNDLACAMEQLVSPTFFPSEALLQAHVSAQLHGCASAHRLRTLGLGEDIDDCAKLNEKAIVPYGRDGRIIL